MRWAHKTDVVTTFRLQFEHHFRQPLVRDFVFLLFFPGLRDLIILAVNAAQIAIAEKDIARASGAGQNRFFAEMRGKRRNNRQSTGITRGDFVPQAIIAAIFRANRAVFEQFFQLLNSLFQFARLPEL